MPANFINTSGNIIANSGNFTTLIVNGSGVSMGGHTHSSSDITNFNSSVSGLVSGIYAPLSGKLDQFANTSSSELSSIISDETGTGLLVFNSSPTLTGVPLVPTATSGTNTNQIASTAFVRTEVSNLVASAPSTLDTLNELASALGNDSNFSTTITNNLAGKANLSGATFTGSISSPSGNFTESLLVNGTTVSISGHTHIASNITDFNSSVSGLLPVKNIIAGTGIAVSSSEGSFTIDVTGVAGGGTTIINPADNRILTSDGTSTGINAESNLIFDGTLLNVSGSGTFASGVNISNQTGSTIASFDANKNVISLTTATYPSLTELSYVKGVTSAIQTQIGTKANSSITMTAGSGIAGGGDLSANRSFDIGQGDGITVNADSIAVDSTVIRTTGTQTITGNKTISVSTGVGLTITNTGTSNSFVVNDESSDTTPFIIDAAGNVGIGTTSPTQKLHITGVLRIGGGGSQSTGEINLDDGVTQYTGNAFQIRKDSSSYWALKSVTAGNDLALFVDNTVGRGLYITNTTGNVGIGTTSPSQKLQIVGNATLSGSLTVSTANTTGGGIILGDDGDIVDLNDAFCSMRFTSGVRIFSGNKTGSAVITLGSNGIVTATTFSGALSGNASTATRSIIEDTRAAQRTPNDYDDFRASYEFTNQFTGLADWHSGFTMQGWSNGYASWQIIGPASTSAHENFYLRSGINTSWNSMRTILHSGNYNSYAPTLTGGGASGTWAINITGNASTATNSTQLGGVAASNYFRVDGSYPNADMNVPVEGYWHVASNAANLPDGALYGHRWDYDHAGDGNWVAQFYSPTGGDAGLWFRQRRGGTWQTWRKFLDSTTFNSYSPTLTGGNASGTWGINITGNAATVGSLSIHAGVNNEANKIVRTDGSGYLYTGWINTISGELGSPKPTRLYASTDAFIRYYPLATFKAHMGLTGKNVFSRAETTTDSNYWVGSMGWGNTNYNTVFGWGSGFTDVWDSPANQPPGTTHWQGIQALHYDNGANSWGFQIACGAGNPDLLYVRGAWGGAPTSWRRIAAGDSRNTRGATRLYRNDNDSDYSVQTYWTGARWRLRGYVGDTYHAEAEVSYADSAGTAIRLQDDAGKTTEGVSVKCFVSFAGDSATDPINNPTNNYNIATVDRIATGQYIIYINEDAPHTQYAIAGLSYRITDIDATLKYTWGFYVNVRNTAGTLINNNIVDLIVVW